MVKNNKYKRLYIISSLFFVTIICIGFCFFPSEEKKEIMRNVSLLHSRKISLPTDQFQVIGEVTDSCYQQNPMKMVIYIDSYICTRCTIKNLATQWKSFVEKKKYNCVVQFIFIISPGHNDIKNVASILKEAQFNHPIYIDSLDIFIKKNPHIPLKGVYHTFLLDENNNVILIGNPINNKKINRLFQKLIKDKLENMNSHLDHTSK